MCPHYVILQAEPWSRVYVINAGWRCLLSLCRQQLRWIIRAAHRPCWAQQAPWAATFKSPLTLALKVRPRKIFLLFSWPPTFSILISRVQDKPTRMALPPPLLYHKTEALLPDFMQPPVQGHDAKPRTGHIFRRTFLGFHPPRTN